ncbi:MAG TPA: maleylpyruvate isomerase family mycothiol-dependent enzyme, partial [Jatrophihabitantaceae bacterium]|nr:maleylpyruvate isomerase family mycothiol-dependent enzyme [Jatrophihabitantaceae bacterium]
SRGRELPAVEVPWMRAREVWLHALDLDVGVSVEELPGDFSEALIEDVLEYFANVPACPAMRIVSEASGREWTLGESRDATVVRGSAPELAAWLTGRSAGQGLRAERLPDLPPWL